MKPYKRFFKEDNKTNYNLYNSYKKFNHLYFNGELPNISIEIVNKSEKFIGQIIGDNKILQINSKIFDSLSDKNKDAILLHEMIHIWVRVSGYDRKNNLHQGQFLIKAKELEKQTGLNIIGRFHKDSETYEDIEKIPVYAVIKTYTKNFLKQNVESIDFYSTADKAEKVVQSIVQSYPERKYFYHIYKIDANSPIILYDTAKKYMDTSSGWINYTNSFVRRIMDNIKKYTDYSKLIKII